MAYGFLDIAVTPSVGAVQARMGVDHLWRDAGHDRAFDRFTEAEAAFIAERDSFYMASVSETGWPYVQHRGGPKGFLRMLDDTTLAFADYSGNRQYISTGNLAANPRTCLFLMDYANRARLKVYAEADVLEAAADPELAAAVETPGYRARIERIYRLRLKAFDWNCAQHITPRFTQAEVSAAVQPLLRRIAELEAQLSAKS